MSGQPVQQPNDTADVSSAHLYQEQPVPNSPSAQETSFNQTQSQDGSFFQGHAYDGVAHGSPTLDPPMPEYMTRNSSAFTIDSQKNGAHSSYQDEQGEKLYPPYRPSANAKVGTVWTRYKWYIVGAIAAILVIVIAVPAAKLANKSSDPSSTRLQSNVADADPRQDAAEPPSNNSDEEEDEVDAEPDSSFWGGDGSEITMRDGTTFTYRNSFGGHWTSAPFNDSAKAQSWSPALNEAWDYGSMRMLGVNLGGWLVPEPFIAPALFEPFQNADTPAIDEYTLSRNLGDDLEATMVEHYETFITERDIADIASAGLNWVRIPIPFFIVIDTVENEPFLQGVGWQYFLRALEWCRKYGLRVNLDLHAVPGSQNGWNHSGKYGSIGLLMGQAGIINAQRTLNTIRSLTQFISQPQYENLVPMFSILNEAQLTVIGATALREFYFEAYHMMREITGIGRGPIITIHDGFMGPGEWDDFLEGADRLGLDMHPYLAFDINQNSDSMSRQIVKPCERWGPDFNRTTPGYGITISGEWSLAINDCGQYLNGVNLGTRYEGDFVEAGRDFPRQGSCDRFGDVANWDSALRAQYLEFTLAEMDVMQNFFFWTWKIGANRNGIVPNPAWSYSLGLQEGYIPRDPRTANGACLALAQKYGASRPPTRSQSPMEPWQTGAASENRVPAQQTSRWGDFPPASLTDAPNADRLPRYTATGTPVTLQATTPTSFPTGSPSTDIGNGWANPSNTAGYYVPISGQDYPQPYINPPTARARAKRSVHKPLR